MLYRRTGQLALQAMLILALDPTGHPRRIRDIAFDLDVPPAYLAKVLQYLTRVGLLRSVRGPSGGVCLGHRPEEITLFDVLMAVEPVGTLEQCLLGLGHCNEQHPCALHNAWVPIRAQILEMIQEKSLLEFVREDSGRSVFETGSCQKRAGIGSPPAEKLRKKGSEGNLTTRRGKPCFHSTGAPSCR